MSAAEISGDSVHLQRISAAPALLSVLRFGLNPLEEMLRLHRRMGPLIEFNFGRPGSRKQRRYVLAIGAKYNKRVLSDPTTFQSIGVMLPGPRESAQRRIGRGLLGPSGENHTHYRRLLLPPLRRTAVDKMARKIGEIIHRELDKWPIGAPVDLFPLCKSVTQLSALETLFPTESGGCSREITAAARRIDEHIAIEAAPLVRGLPLNLPGLPYHRMLRHAEAVEAALVAWVRKESTPARHDNLMSLLANSPDETGVHPGDKAVLNHLPTLFAAAYETCQTALTWALFLLAQHPQASAALLEELAALPDDDPERFLDCKRLDAVIHESLRLLPSVPTQTRRTSRDTDLVDCNIRKGAYVILSAFLTNRDPGTFTEPDRFKPERWDAIDPTQYEYLVFSAGPRTCIGSWFASTYLKVAIGQIVKRFRLRIVPNAHIDQNVRLTLRPGKGGVPAIIHQQDGRFEASPISGNIRRIVRFA